MILPSVRDLKNALWDLWPGKIFNPRKIDDIHITDDKIQNINFDGDILSDITSFNLAQNLFDGKKNITSFDVYSFDSTIQMILFYDTVHIIEPFTYGGLLDISTPEMWNKLSEKSEIVGELTNKKIINQISHEKYSHHNFYSQYYEMKKLIEPDKSFQEFAKKNQKVMSYLAHYQNNTEFVHDDRMNMIANRFGLNLELLSLVVNMYRFNSSISYINEIECDQNKRFILSPSITRIPLANTLINYNNIKLESRSKNEINRLLSTIGEDQDKKWKRRNIRYGEMDRYEFKMPVLSTWILSHCNGKDDVLDEILETRKTKPVRDFREFIKEYQTHLIKSGYIPDPEMEEKLNEELDDFEDDFDKPDTQRTKLRSFFEDVPLSLTEGFRLGTRTAVDTYYRKDLAFLFNLKKDCNDIRHSKEQFERIFHVDLKNYKPEKIEENDL